MIGMARMREVIERLEKLEAEVVELRKQVASKSAPKSTNTKTTS